MIDPSKDNPLHDASLQRLLGFLATDPNNVTLREDVFDAALAAGLLPLAQEQAGWVLSRTPSDFGWRHRLALLDMAQHQWDEAALILRSLVDEGQSDLVVSYNLAYVEFLRGHYRAALHILEPMLEAAIDRVPDALALYMRCLHREGSLAQALAAFERLAPRAATAQTLGVASLLAVDNEELAKARSWSSRALALDGRQHDALVARASVALAQRDPATAMAALDAALAVMPNDGRTLSALGMARLLQHDLAGAHAALSKAVQIMPGHIGTWHTLAWCEIVSGNLSAAQLSFERALELDRTFGETHGGVAVVQALQDRSAEAEDSIRRALKLAPQSLSARYAQAVLRGEVRDPSRFEAMVRDILSGQKDIGGRPLADVILGAH